MRCNPSEKQPGDHHAQSRLPHASLRALRDVAVGRCSHHGDAIQGRFNLLRAHLLSEGRRPCRRHHDAHRSQRPIGDVQFARRGEHDHLHQFHHGFALRRCRRSDYTSSNAGSPSPFTTARRDNVEVSSQTVSLKGTQRNSRLAFLPQIRSPPSATRTSTPPVNSWPE